MKKIFAIALSALLLGSVAASFSACADKGDVTKTDADTSASSTDEGPVKANVDATKADAGENETQETTAENKTPEAGETVEIAEVKIVIPAGWKTEDYTAGKEIKISAEDGPFLNSVKISVKTAWGDENAETWAENTNKNYGGGKEIDRVTIGGREFYRVKALEEQNICFTDLPDGRYLEIAVMMMPWAGAEAALESITIE